ncbi:MAG: response regulator [bacterium]
MLGTQDLIRPTAKVQKKVLLIDDDRFILHSLGEMLTMKGYQVIKAQSAEEGLQLFEKESPPIVMADIMMPDMDGLELLQKIHRINSDAEVIMITAYDRADLAIEALHLQAADFLAKPIRPQQLFSSVKRAEDRIRNKKRTRQYINRLEQALDDRTQRLLQSEKQAAIGSRVRGIIHNVSTPLAVVSSRAEYLAGKLQDLKELPEVQKSPSLQEGLDKRINEVNVILKNAQKIAMIIDTILTKSYKEQFNHLIPIDINELITDEITFFQSDLYFKHNIKSQHWLDADLPKVKMIYSHLSQVLDNLIKNAIEAMYDSQEKKLTISTAQDEHSILIKIQDTGCGIPAKNIKKIFTPHFTTKSYQQRGEREPIPSGSGLGLSASLNLMEMYGGKILVRSKPNEGSEFTIVIPKNPAPPRETEVE